MNEHCPICGGRHDHHRHQAPRPSASPAGGQGARTGFDFDGRRDGEGGESTGPASSEDDQDPVRVLKREPGHGSPAPDPGPAEGRGRCGRGPDQAAAEPADPGDRAVSPVPGRAVYHIANMDCPMEETLIRNKLKGMAGLTGLEFDLFRRILTVHHRLDSLASLEAALAAIHMRPSPIAARRPEEGSGPEPAADPWRRLGVAAFLALVAEAAHLTGRPDWASLVPALAAIGLGGLATYKKGWVAVKHFNLNMNALMSFAVTGALLIGQWPEAAMVMVLFSLAEAVEAKSLARARAAMAGLLKLTPQKATIKGDDGLWREVPADQVPAGRLARVRPGERVALDGVIVSGASALNQAPITGESLPVEKTVGDQVFAGTVNESGSFEYQVTAAFANSTLARIIRAVEEAQAGRAPMQRFVDRFAQIYTPVVFGAAILAGVLPPLFWDGDWLGWAYKALVLLVIACPCALVISTPVTIVSGLAAATRHGLLIKGGAFLEKGRRLKWIALDKTGTITQGRPEQTDFQAWGGADPAVVRRPAVSLAARSDHPVSLALARAGQRDGVEPEEVFGFTALLGYGVVGTIGGHEYFLANAKFFKEKGWWGEELEEAVRRLESRGRSVVLLAGEGRVLALLAVADGLKAGVGEAMARLKSLGIKTMMLTGDNRAVAREVAAEAGVDDFRGDLLPADKLAAIKGLAREGPVGMVGDGINDAPALAGADIGFAMGAAGTGAAIETADVALMDDDLGKLGVFVRLSRATHRILWQNITLALGLKLAFFILTFFGITTMWMAVFADIGVSLMVVANGLRMLRA